MSHQELIKQLKKKNSSKIVFLVADGLGGIPDSPNGKTELETARKPHIDNLTKNNVSGLSIPVLPGITPGSGQGHLGLFGYDPVETVIGRGILEALGIDFDLEKDDVALRGNFCTMDENGLITDRRAGRISTEKCAELVNKLKQITIPGITLLVEPVQDHRFILILRGGSLGGNISDTDPQLVGKAPHTANGQDEKSKKSAEIVNEFIKQAKDILKNDSPANMLTFRGAGKLPQIPTMEEVYGLKSAAISVYPMYKGISKLVGMNVLKTGKTFTEQIETLKENWEEFDFFFVHYKYTDSKGEDGNFDEKVKHIETIDTFIPEIMKLNPDVFVLTGDHSTPAVMSGHSWHSVPTLLVAKNCRTDNVSEFGERACLMGGLGQFESKYLMSYVMANAGRLGKFGG